MLAFTLENAIIISITNVNHLKGALRMLNKIKNRKQEGFTIIEVLIVLAIAGLIMLIVFLAVPALQRNSRNTQRTNDASRVSAAVTECLNNNNGSVTTCANDTIDDTSAGIGKYIDITSNQQLTGRVDSFAGVGGAGASEDTNAFTLTYETKCNPEGTAAATGGGKRAFTVTYNAETSGGITPRCVGS